MLSVINILLLLIAFVLSLFVYFFAIKPYLILQTLKRQFQGKGYKVLVQPINFMKQQILPTFQTNFKTHKNSHYHLTHKYQGYDVIIHNSLNHVFIWIANVDLVKDAYTHIQHLQKISIFRTSFIRLYGGGLLVSQGKEWKAKRKLYSQIFNFKILEDLHPHIQTVVQNTMNSWKIQNQLDMLSQFRKMLFNVFVVSYFGCQFEGFSYKNQTYGQSMVRLFDQVFTQSFDWKNVLFGTKGLEVGLTKKDKQIHQHIEVIKSQTKAFVLKRFEQIQKEGKQKQNYSILSKLVFGDYFKNVSQQQKDKKIEDIVGDVIIFFFGGTDTTSVALASTLHILNKKPIIKNKLLQQLKSVSYNINTSSIKKLKYMDAVFHQILRMYGPANMIVYRQMTNNKTQIGEVSIPKSVFVGIQTNTIHHSQKYYDNPYEFIPERWIDQNNNVRNKSQKTQNPYSFVAFSGGARNCIGQHLARMEYKIILGKLLAKYQFSTNDQMAMNFKFIYMPEYNNFKLCLK